MSTYTSNTKRLTGWFVERSICPDSEEPLSCKHFLRECYHLVFREETQQAGRKEEFGENLIFIIFISSHSCQPKAKPLRWLHVLLATHLILTNLIFRHHWTSTVWMEARQSIVKNMNMTGFTPGHPGVLLSVLLYSLYCSDLYVNYLHVWQVYFYMIFY